MELTELLIFVGVGVFTGLSAGLFGIGGGLVSVPAMVFILPYFDVPTSQIMHVAIATSLALIIPTSIISTYSHWRNDAIMWRSVRRLVPGLIFGAALGAYLVLFFEEAMLKTVFSVFLMLIAVSMLKMKPKEISGEQRREALSFFSLPAVIIGAISSLMGVGGGTMTVPYLSWRGMLLPKAIGTSAFCGLPIALSGSLVFFLLQAGETSGDEGNYIRFTAFVGILVGVIFFTPIGAKLTHSINVILLRRVFVVMLFLVVFRFWY